MDRRPKTRAFVALSLATLTLTASAWTPAFASGNPMDRVGIEHNVYLGCLMRNGGDLRVSPLQRIVEECGFNPGVSTSDFVERYSPLLESDPNQTVAGRMAPYRKMYTDDQFSYFERIDRVLASARNQTEADVMLAQLESEAVAQLTSGTLAEGSILAGLSTARHSLEYWSKAAAAPTATGSPTLAQRRWPWKKILFIGGSDAIGAIVGFAVGGWLGGVALGAGASIAAYAETIRYESSY